MKWQLSVSEQPQSFQPWQTHLQILILALRYNAWDKELGSSRDDSVMPQIFTIFALQLDQHFLLSLSSVWWYDPMNVHFLQWGLCMKELECVHKLGASDFFFFFFCFTYFRYSQVGLWYNVLEKKSAFSQTCYETVNYIWSCSRFSNLDPAGLPESLGLYFPQEKLVPFSCQRFLK